MTHNLIYIHTASSGNSNIPEYEVSFALDGSRGGYCYSSGKVEPKLDWAEKLIQDQPELKELYDQWCITCTNIYRARYESIRKELNQNEGTLL